MKKVFVFVILIITLTACTTPAPIPYNNIRFEKETNVNYAGSYYISRVNLREKWNEWGEWKPIEVRIRSTIVCFGAFDSSRDAIFRASQEYQWVEIVKGGRNCLELQKIK